jgi:hypothetical protein
MPEAVPKEDGFLTGQVPSVLVGGLNLGSLTRRLGGSAYPAGA